MGLYHVRRSVSLGTILGSSRHVEGILSGVHSSFTPYIDKDTHGVNVNRYHEVIAENPRVEVDGVTIVALGNDEIVAMRHYKQWKDRTRYESSLTIEAFAQSRKESKALARKVTNYLKKHHISR
jgi:hypothetical protein